MTRHNEKGLLRDRRGAVGAWVALMLVMLLGVASLTIDMGFLWVLRHRLQSTADASALAGASQLTETPDPAVVKAEAVAYAQKNMSTSAHGTVLTDPDVVLGHWDQATRTFTTNATGTAAPTGEITNAVQVTTRSAEANGNAVSLFLAPVLGIQKADVVTESTAVFEPPAASAGDRWDVMLVQDVTQSFTTELDEAREAGQALLDCVNNEASEESLFGLVTFTGFSTVLAPQQTLEDGYDSLSSAISSIARCGWPGMPVCSGTHIGAGMDEAINQYNNSPPAGPGIKRAMVIVSDGKPNARAFPEYSDADLENLAIASADTAWAEEIHVSVMFYDDSNDDVAADFLSSLVRGEGIFMRTLDPTDLPDLMVDVCAQGMGMGQPPPPRLVN